MKKSIRIILYCLNCIEFCQKASKHMIADPINDDTIRKTCESVSKIFSSFGRDFQRIAHMAGLELDLTTQKGEKVLKKINSLADLNKTQRKNHNIIFSIIGGIIVIFGCLCTVCYFINKYKRKQRLMKESDTYTRN